MLSLSILECEEGETRELSFGLIDFGFGTIYLKYFSLFALYEDPGMGRGDVEGCLTHSAEKWQKWPLQKNVQKWHRMAKHGKTPNRISRTSKQLVYCYRQ